MIDLLVAGVADGTYYPANAKCIGSALIKSGRGGGGINIFGKLGNKLSKNVERDLHRRTCNWYGVCIDVTLISLVVSAAPMSGVAIADPKCEASLQPALAPYEVISALYQKSPDMFHTTMFGTYTDGAKCCQEFWATLGNTCPHPVHGDASINDFSCVIPVLIHIDGIEIFKDSSWAVWSVMSVFAHMLPSNLGRMFIGMLDEDTMWKIERDKTKLNETNDCFLEWVSLVAYLYL
jgi:hypothetical protein